MKRRNKINSKKFGTKGELTEQLALVLKALWTCRDTPEHSIAFKAVVDRYGTQFRSSTQHDAQEFLFWLLDKVHEDLNMATKRRYKAMKVSSRCGGRRRRLQFSRAIRMMLATAIVIITGSVFLTFSLCCIYFITGGWWRGAVIVSNVHSRRCRLFANRL